MNSIEFSNVTEDGIKISGTYYKNKKSNYYVAILLHGFSSNQNNSTNVSLLPKLYELSFDILTFDFRGCGLSNGELGKTTITSGVDDLKSAIHAVKNLDPSFTSKEILFIGSSFGGSVSLAAPPELPIKGFVLKSPMLNIEGAQLLRRGELGMQKWENDGYVKIKGKYGSTDLSYAYVSDSKNYNFLEPKFFIKNYPISIIHGTNDEIAPIHYSEEFASIDKKSRKLIKILNANHHYSDGNDFELMINNVLQEVKLLSGK